MIDKIFGLMDGQTFMIIIGVGLFIWLTITRLDKTGIGYNMVNRLLVICIISAAGLILGAMFFDDFWHAIEEGYFQNFGTFVNDLGFFGALAKFTTYGGITFLGGLYGCLFFYVIAYWFIFKHERHNLIHYLDIVLPGLILAHGLGRIGCFLVGCCYGKPAPAPWGVLFPYAHVLKPEVDFIPEGYINPKDVHVLPTNLYEGIFLIALFFILIFVIKKNQTKFYFVMYGTFRFFLEFLRGDSRGKIPFLGDILSPSQLLSLIMLIVGILLFVFGNKFVNWLKRFDRELKTKNKEASAKPVQ